MLEAIDARNTVNHYSLSAQVWDTSTTDNIAGHNFVI